MKNTNLYNSLFFILVLFVACGSAEQKSPVKKNETKEIVANGNKKVVDTTTPKKKAARQKPNGKMSYWTKLQKAIGLNQDQLKGAQEISIKYAKQIRALNKTKPNGFKNKIQAKRNAEKNEMRKLLGDTLYEKKIAYDNRGAKKNK